MISEDIREAAMVLKNGHYSAPASCQSATTQWVKEADILGSWLEDGGLKTAVPRHEAKLFYEVYVHFKRHGRNGYQIYPWITQI